MYRLQWSWDLKMCLSTTEPAVASSDATNMQCTITPDPSVHHVH